MPTAPLPEGVLAKMREGADLYNAGKYWHAHEAWEDAWKLLKERGLQRAADFVQGMILVAAAFENLQRGKEPGFKRQLANGLQKLRANAGAGASLGVANEAAWERALTDLYLDCCRTLKWEWWREQNMVPPQLLLQ